jgi:hypothetical protein
VKILGAALAVAPCLVLTNGTAPLIRRLHQLDLLRSHPNALEFRVSIDHADAGRHDAGRGWGNFRRALEGLALLHQRGFRVSVTRQTTEAEDPAAVSAAFRNTLARHGLPSDLKIVALPDYGPPGRESPQPAVTALDLMRRRSSPSRNELMCSLSKMVVKRVGAMRVYACPLVDDDGGFDQGATLAEALSREVRLRHHRCHSCLKSGASMSALQGDV